MDDNETLLSRVEQLSLTINSIIKKLKQDEDCHQDILNMEKINCLLQNNLNGIVYLNVGGTFIDTTMSTLRAVDSMLSVMVSGLFELSIDRNDRIFIDADGPIFKDHILPFLRRCSRGSIDLPDRESMELRVWEEFEYFGLIPADVSEENIPIEFVGSQMLDVIGNEITKQKRCYGVAWSVDKYFFAPGYSYVLEAVITKVPANGIIRIYMGIIQKIPTVNIFYSYKEGKYFLLPSAAVGDRIRLIISNGEMSLKQNDILLETTDFDIFLEYHLAVDLPWQNYQTTSLTIEQFYSI